MHIYLRHPDHGTKVATMDLEAIYDEENGWTRYTPGQPTVNASANELVSRRRGRRPSVEEVAADDNDSGRSD
jgi:hypothetical protein